MLRYGYVPHLDISYWSEKQGLSQRLVHRWIPTRPKVPGFRFGGHLDECMSLCKNILCLQQYKLSATMHHIPGSGI
jgi:hypothetical protein